jgi:hypothetical protein
MTGGRENPRQYRDSNTVPSVVQLIASLYTDGAIPTPQCKCVCVCMHIYIYVHTHTFVTYVLMSVNRVSLTPAIGHGSCGVLHESKPRGWRNITV